MNGSERLSRREFLIGGSGFVAGAAVGSVLGGGLFALSPAKASEPAAPAWPWPYQTLDPERGRKLGYELYYQGG
ncbi:MAG TPA: hypothetical protein GXX28_11485 [Firmicutes bacterium]|nr:hypothetical protein [Bacillota bacterium]